MFFFGWGTRNKSWPLPDGRVIMVSWKYFHLFWFICFVTKSEWFLLSDKRSDDQIITNAAAQMMLPGEEVQVPFFYRYGGVIIIGGIWAYSIFGSLFH